MVPGQLNSLLEILKLCNKLLKTKLSKSDKDWVLLIKTQLETDWRKHLLIKLNKLVRKYDK
jgi:hypothetical protein